MPNDNIKSVLQKAASAGQGDSYESITYEGHGPSGVAVIVETMTDHRNRTAGNIRHHFDKYGGSLGVNGCVSWAFDKKGVIVIDNEEEELDEDAVMMDALDAGAADFQPEGAASPSIPTPTTSTTSPRRSRTRATSSSPRRSNGAAELSSSISPKISPTWKKCSTSSRMMMTSERLA